MENRFANKTGKELKEQSENVFSFVDNNFVGFNFDPSSWGNAVKELIDEIVTRNGFNDRENKL